MAEQYQKKVTFGKYTKVKKRKQKKNIYMQLYYAFYVYDIKQERKKKKKEDRSIIL